MQAVLYLTSLLIVSKKVRVSTKLKFLYSYNLDSSSGSRCAEHSTTPSLRRLADIHIVRMNLIIVANN